MIVAPEERRSQGPLIVFIDLLFLLVAFFTLLLFFINSRQEISEERLRTVEQRMEQITGQELDLPEAMAQLESVAERFLARREHEAERERRIVERQRRRAQKTTFRLEYRITADGRIAYGNEKYTLQQFREQVVEPLRSEHWVAFRGFATPDTAFGQVVRSRRVLLENAGEFDTYWDNLTRRERETGSARR